MVAVVDRNVNCLGRKIKSNQNLYFSKAIILLFSRIILRKLDSGSKSIFRKVEKISKVYLKLNADLKIITNFSK